jgi:hypothetical protein
MGDDDVSEPGWHLSRGGKTWGPLSDKQFRLLIEKGKLKSDDLIWRPGFKDWRSADTVLGRSSPPPIPNNQSLKRARSQGRAWKLGVGAAVVTAVIAALYIASPYYTLWRLKHAVETKDSLALERIVDWPRLREQLKFESLASFTSLASTMTENNGALATLGTALGAAMIAPLVESTIQPAALIRAVDNNPALAEKIKSVDVRSGYFLAPTTFRLDIEGPDATKLGLILEFQGAGWRVTHVDFPWEKFQTEIEHSRNEYVGSPEWKKELDELLQSLKAGENPKQ